MGLRDRCRILSLRTRHNLVFINFIRHHFTCTGAVLCFTGSASDKAISDVKLCNKIEPAYSCQFQTRRQCFIGVITCYLLIFLLESQNHNIFKVHGKLLSPLIELATLCKSWRGGSAVCMFWSLTTMLRLPILLQI